ncbi:hypothetical protein PT974_04788 [Cladobotryum mycophilum]|uniref:Heterokaryon incompatibility domain-containing protein n=1 Tax=Cladobotryum mycophilum TaxID=491253 RepID=A0ABR0SQ56_9HYPO
MLDKSSSEILKLPLATGYDPSVTSGARPLCSDCQKLVVWIREPSRKQDDCLKSQFKANLKTPRLLALDCLLCKFVLYKVFDGRVLNKHWADEETLPYTVVAQPHGERSQGLFEVFWEETLPYPSPGITIPAYYYFADPVRIGKRAVWQESEPTFDSRLQTLAQWISDCECLHGNCVEEPSTLPRRLLDLSELEQLGQVKLIESSTIIERSIKYATLSHCWGPPTFKPPLRTTKFSYAEHSRGISLNHLTLNFHDAVLICRKIGLSYVWIDSLCIIQDDGADWEAEAVKMADVYRGGYINIAVNAAHDAHGGIIDGTLWQREFGSLSGGNISAGADPEVLDFSSPYAAHNTWMWWIESYSIRQLTYASDISHAIAGLISYFRKKTGCRPILGMWEETLAFDLNWRHDFRCKKPDKNMFPSWSWLSILPRSDRREKLQPGGWHNNAFVPLRVELWEEKWAGVPYTSKLESSRLIISSFARNVTIRLPVDGSADALVAATGPEWNGGRGRYYSISYLEHGVSHLAVKVVHLAQYTRQPTSTDIDEPTPFVIDAFLVLKPSDDRPGCYERIGTGWVETEVEGGWKRGKHCDVNFKESGRESIELV